MTWRDYLRPIIARVLAEHPGADTATLTAALRKKFLAVWGPEHTHDYAYKIWLDEIARQTGRKLKPQSPKISKRRSSLV